MKFFALLLVSVLFFYACSTNQVNTSTTTVIIAQDSVYVHLYNLPILDTNYRYEAWMEDAFGSLVSLGNFRLEAQSDTQRYRSLDTSFYGGTANVTAMVHFVLSVESKNDQNPAISRTRILAATFDYTDDDTAMATMDNFKSFGVNFRSNLSASTFRFILSTPTDGNTNTNESSGLWFVEPKTSGGYTEGIYSLPSLPSGWKYEGWMVKNGALMPINPNNKPLYLTTGKFITNRGADESSPYSQTTAQGYAFPGEDFLINAPSGVTFPFQPTAGKDAVYITVEPYPDDNIQKPFFVVFSATLDVLKTNTLYDNGVYILGTKYFPVPSGLITR